MLRSHTSTLSLDPDDDPAVERQTGREGPAAEYDAGVVALLSAAMLPALVGVCACVCVCVWLKAVQHWAAVALSWPRMRKGWPKSQRGW